MQNRYDLVGVGKVNVDVVRLPSGRLADYVGGHVPNVLSVAARLGMRTALIARVGNDQEGKYCLEELRRRGVDTTFVQADNDPTSVMDVEVAAGGDRILKPRPGVLTAYQREKHQAAIRNADRVFIGNSTIGFGECADDCAAANVELISSLQSVTDPDGIRAKALLKHPPRLLFASQDEAEKCRNVVDIVLARKGIVVVTMGAEGCKVLQSINEFRFKAFEAKVVDATGAGDAFAAAFIACQKHKADLGTSATMASAAGAIAVSEEGPVPRIDWNRINVLVGGRRLAQR